MIVFSDVKYVIRLLFKKPAFTVTTIMIMSVGLALSIYTYSVLNTLLFKPLEMKKEGGALVKVTGGFDRSHLWQRPLFTYSAKYLRDHTQSFSEISIHSRGGVGTALISGRDSSNTAKKLNSTFAEWNIFQVVGVQPIMGRALVADDHLQGAEPVIVLSYEVWEGFFSKDPNIVDRIINVDAEPVRIVGVMPKGFSFPDFAQTWQPTTYETLYPTPEMRRGTEMLARLKTDVTFRQAAAELKKIEQAVRAELPEMAEFIDFELIPFKMSNTQKFMPLLTALSIVVLLILLLACINVGNLLLSRVNERIKEVAIRVALGVPRSRLVMQMLWESILICTFSGLLALLIAAWGLDLTNTLLDSMFSVQQNKPFWWQLGIDSHTVWTLFGIIVFTIALTGAVPAWRAMSGDFNAVLRDGTRGALSKKSAKVAQVLVVSEILLSCIVLTVASMVLTTTFQASRADYGIETENSLIGLVELPSVTYSGRNLNTFTTQVESESVRLEMENKRIQFYERLKFELESEPNIISLASMGDVPGTGGGWSYFDVEGQEYPSLEMHPKANNEGVMIGSLKAMGIKLLEGRYFDERDRKDNDEVIVISKTLAETLYPNESALGKRNRWMRTDRTEFGPWRTIIGVVSDVIHGPAIDTSSMVQTMYHPHTQSGGVFLRFNVVVKYQGSEAQARQTLGRVLKSIDPDVPVYDVRSYERLLAEPMFLITSISKLFLLCGLIAIFLSATGIYAVVSNSISQRTQEIGLRRAVGATDRRVLNLFMVKSVWQLAWGIGAGVIAAIFITLKMTDMIVIQSLAYSIAFIVIPIVIISIVLCATFIPTNRALRFEPSDALHYE